MKTPDLSPRQMALDLDYANRLLGLELSAPEARKLLEKMRFGVESKKGKADEKTLHVLVPAYRTDVLHPIDLVEDIAIAYGYENFTPEIPKLHTTGSVDAMEKFSSDVRELMLGVGFQEVMTLIMTNRRNLFERMNLSAENIVETESPLSEEHSVARNWLLPSLMNVLEKNTGREYPQKIFEVGDTITPKGETRRKLAGVVAHSKTNYSEMKSIVAGILESLGVKYGFNMLEHGSFIKGRCASTEYGFFGEIHPLVLENFGLEVPVTGFELDLSKIPSGK